MIKRKKALKEECKKLKSFASPYGIYFTCSERHETLDLDYKNDNCREQREKYKFCSGAIYDGEWVGNQRDGQGV